MSTTLSDNVTLLGPGLHYRTVRLTGADLLWLRGLLEAYDGLGFVLGYGDGLVHVVTTESQAATLDDWLNDLQFETDFLSESIPPLPLSQSSNAVRPPAQSLAHEHTAHSSREAEPIGTPTASKSRQR